MDKGQQAPATLPGLAPPVEFSTPGAVPLRGLRWTSEERSGSLNVPTYVFLHGLGDGADTWRPVIDTWPDSALPQRMLALDLPGHGGSAWIENSAYTLDRLCMAVGSALGKLGAEEIVLIGHSLGAQVALKLASERQVLCDALVLVDMGLEHTAETETAISAHFDRLATGAKSQEDLVTMVMSQLPLADRNAVEDIMACLAKRNGHWVSLHLDPGAKVLLGETCAHTTLRRLTALDMPVAILRGAISGILTRPDSDRMRTAVRGGAVFRTIPRAGHSIAIEQPAALALTLVSAIEEMMFE